MTMATTMAADDDDNGPTGNKVDDDGDDAMGNKVDDDGNRTTGDDNNGDGAPCTAKTRSRYLERPNILGPNI